jgi:hypothetical protein
MKPSIAGSVISVVGIAINYLRKMLSIVIDVESL